MGMGMGILASSRVLFHEIVNKYYKFDKGSVGYETQIVRCADDGKLEISQAVIQFIQSLFHRNKSTQLQYRASPL